MEFAYHPQIDLIEKTDQETKQFYSSFTLRPIEDLQDIEQKFLNQDQGLVHIKCASERPTGNTLDSFFTSFSIALFEKSLFIDNALQFWEELVWRIDSNPLMDKSDEVGGQVSLHLNDVIQASVQARNKRPILLESHLKPALQLFYSKMAFTYLPQQFNALLKKLVWNSVDKQGMTNTETDLVMHPPILSDLLPPSSSLATLANFFRVRIIVICKTSYHNQPRIIKYSPSYPYHFFGQNYFAGKDITLAVGEEEGWRIIYSEQEKEEFIILNSVLENIKEPEESKRQFSEQDLLEFIPLGCGCCPSVRRVSLLSYLDWQFPHTLKLEDRFITYDCKFYIRLVHRQPHRPVCLNNVPIPVQTLQKVIRQPLDRTYFKNRVDLAIKQPGPSSQKKQYRTSIKKVRKYEPLSCSHHRRSHSRRSSGVGTITAICCCCCLLKCIGNALESINDN